MPPSSRYEREQTMKLVFAFMSLFSAIFIIVAAIWVGASAMEARAYNRLTGNDVSTWDAMWVNLRVQDAPQE
jgi:hypothetical protein